MKYFRRLLFSLFCISRAFVSVSTENVYEQVSPYLYNSGIVDPNSIYHNSQSKTVKICREVNVDENEITISQENVVFYKPFCKDNHYEVFTRRLVNMLILKSKFKMNNGLMIGKLELEATFEELEMLKGFGEGKISVRQIDDIISNVIRPIQINLIDEALNFTDNLAMYLFQHRIMFGTLLLTIFVIILAVKVKWTRLKIIFLLFDLVVIISFILTWWELLQEAEIQLITQQHIYVTMPDECRQHQISFYRSLLLFLGFGKNDCKKYFEAIMTDPVLKVTPLHAFSHMTSKFFLYPITLVGQYCSDFVDKLTRALPFPFNIIVQLLLLSFVPCLLGGLFFVSLGGSTGIRFGPFLHIYLHGRQLTPPSYSIANNDRQVIEIIQSETLQVDAVSSEIKPALTEKKKNLKNEVIEGKANIDKSNRIETLEESDANSDKFSEKKEYEKILKRILENEINKTSEVKIGKNELLLKDKETDTSDLGTKTKKSIKLSSGDH